jgi:hypothetical protein
MDTPLRKDQETPLRGVRTNIVQSIRAFRVQDLQDAASRLGHHFLYANLAHAQSKQDVLDLIAAAVHLSVAFRQELRCAVRLHDRPAAQVGAAAGLHRGARADSGHAKFDKEAREQLLDIFRDAADYWGDRKIPFRCFYSFL